MIGTDGAAAAAPSLVRLTKKFAAGSAVDPAELAPLLAALTAAGPAAVDAVERFVANHPAIVAVWHGQFMMLAAFNPKDLPVSAMVARHADAEVDIVAVGQLPGDPFRHPFAGLIKAPRRDAAAGDGALFDRRRPAHE